MERGLRFVPLDTGVFDPEVRVLTLAPIGHPVSIEELHSKIESAHLAVFLEVPNQLVLQGVAYGPADHAPVLLFGIVRVDGTAVYGSLSNENGFQPVRLSPHRFAFAVRFDALALLPGKYRLRAHTLDDAGLRLFDTIEVEFVVTGQTRDFGVVGLTHSWLPGRGEAQRIE